MRILLFLIFILLVGASLSFYFLFPEMNFLSQHKSEQIIQEKRELEFLLEGAKRLSRAWREGDSEGLWKTNQLKCPNALGQAFVIGSDYLKCNPRYILCLMESKGLKIDLDGEEREVILQEADYHLITPANANVRNLARASYLFELRLSRSNKSLPLLLEEDCREVFLPERIYKYKNFIWDNYHANIFVDQYPVTFLEVADWLRFSPEEKNEKIELPKIQAELSHYAYGLNLEQMKSYCAFKGKQLMSSEVYDAASFYPADLNNPQEELIVNAPYSWTRKKKITNEEALCSKIYSEECLTKAPLVPLSNEAATWSGMFLSLGGPLEALYNPVDPEQNLKASSFYFPFNSSWQQLGARAHWEGEETRERDFDWGKKQPRPKVLDGYQIGFRCMRTVYHHERP